MTCGAPAGCQVIMKSKARTESQDMALWPIRQARKPHDMSEHEDEADIGLEGRQGLARL
jgi:hypothetical protein